MDRISINLLPPSLKENKQLNRKKKLVNQVSIGFLGILILITISLIVATVFQNNSFKKEFQMVDSLQKKINDLKESEAAVIILKKRLATISQLNQKQYPQPSSYLLVASLLPPDVFIQSFNIDKSNIVSVQGNAVSAADMQKFFDNLSDPTANEGKVTKTTISNLSRGPTPRLIFDLSITTNFGAIKK